MQTRREIYEALQTAEKARPHRAIASENASTRYTHTQWRDIAAKLVQAIEAYACTTTKCTAGTARSHDFLQIERIKPILRPLPTGPGICSGRILVDVCQYAAVILRDDFLHRTGQVAVA